MNKILLVFIGGGIGSMCRHLISLLCTPFNSSLFPIATFTANLLGCFIIGLLAGKINLNHKLNLFLVTGFCGGFTTFSTFSKESMFLVKEGHILLTLLYVISSILIGIILVWFGYMLSNKKTPRHMA